MKLTAGREALLRPLQSVIGVVERRQTMPILANVLLVARNGQVAITATDLEVELVASAEVIDGARVPLDHIGIGSVASLRDLDTGEGMVYSLVFPTEAKYDEGRISVLAPVGTAMLGYRVGATIEWQVPSGLRRLKVEELLYQPEAAGDYNL